MWSKIMMSRCKLWWICAEMIKIQVGRWMTLRQLTHFFYLMTLLLIRELRARRDTLQRYLLLMEMWPLPAPKSQPVLLELRSGIMVLKSITPWQSRKRKTLEPIGSSWRVKERSWRIQIGRKSLTAKTRMISTVLASIQRSSREMCLNLWQKKLNKSRKRQ